ncbi:MAG: hypothetical protein PHP06_06380 [Clostridia bacterium]|nr:hypothetical protein [Clostridia bacterium]
MKSLLFDMERLKNHFYYDWWKYIVGIIATFIIWSFIATVTRPQVPPEKKLDVYLVGSITYQDELEELSEKMLEDFPDLEEINFLPIQYKGEEDIYGRQKIFVLLGARSGDLFAFSEQDYKEIAGQGAFVNLDPFIDRGVIEDNTDYQRYRLYADQESEKHLYGIPLEDITIFDNTSYSYKDKVISVVGYSQNKDNAIKFLKWLIEKGK